MFMTEQCRQSRMGRAHGGLDTLLTRSNAQWQSVDEHAQCTFGPFATVQAAHQHGTEDHVLASGQTPDHLSQAR